MTKCGDYTHGKGEECYQQQGTRDEKREERPGHTYVGGAFSTISNACVPRLSQPFRHHSTKNSCFVWIESTYWFRKTIHRLFSTMYTRFLVVIGLLVGASAGSLRTHEKPLDKLSDDELGIKRGDLTPALLKKYKKRVTQLKASLDSLMARQTVLNVEYNTLLRQENRDSDLKRKVKGMVARSVLKGMAELTDDRKQHVSGIVDQTVKRIKDEYSLKIPHPDISEPIEDTVNQKNASRTNSTGPTSNSTDSTDAVRLDKESDGSGASNGDDQSGASGSSGAEGEVQSQQ